MMIAIVLFLHEHLYLVSIGDSDCVRTDKKCEFYKYNEGRTIYISIFAAVLSFTTIPYLVCDHLGLKRQQPGFIAFATVGSMLVAVAAISIFIAALVREIDAFQYINDGHNSLKDLIILLGKYFTHSYNIST